MDRLTTIFLFLLLSSLLVFPGETIAQQSAQITLAGYNHKPPVPTTASGFVTVEVHNDTLQVHGEFSDLSGWYRGAYIMVGERGENGNQLFRLKATLEDSRTEGTFETETNSFALKEAHKELLRTGELYINIASGDHRQGELRGQIPALDV